MTAPDLDCMWCAATGKLATFTEGGEVDESTDCVCVLGERLRERTAERDAAREELAIHVGSRKSVLRAERDEARSEVARWIAAWERVVKERDEARGALRKLVALAETIVPEQMLDGPTLTEARRAARSWEDG